MADETTGGLTAIEDPTIKETRPKVAGVNIAGQKGVSLEPENSMEVRNRLLEMIKQREAERSGFGALLENLAVFGQDPNSSLDTRMANYNDRKRQRNQDIFNMQLGVSQLDTEEKRLAQARAEQLQNRQQFGNLLTGGVGGGAPGGEQGGQIASPQQVASFAQNLNKDQAAALMMLYRQNPAEATKQLIQLTKLTDSQREAHEAGLTPGSPDYQAFMRLKLAGSGAFTPHDVRTSEGTIERTPLDAARPTVPGPLSTPPAPEPATVAPPPAPAVAQASGALPTTVPVTPPVSGPLPAPVTATAPAPAAAPVRLQLEDGTYARTPDEFARQINSEKDTSAETKKSLIARYREGYAQLMREQDARNRVRTSTTASSPTTVTPPAAVTPPTTVTPPAAATTTTSPTGFKPGSKEDLAARQKQAEANIEFEKQRKLKEEESRIAIEQQNKLVPIEGAKTESQKVGEANAAEQTVHSDNVKLAPTNALIANQLEKDINAVPGLLNKLGKRTIFSAIMNIADKGVQVGNLGSISIPGLKDAIVQLDPEVRNDKTGKKLEAYQRVINNISRIGLEFARAVNKGMGSMSNYERSIVEQAVGDPNRMTANNLMIKAKALECDAKNAMEKDKLWGQMKNAGYDWAKFKKSPEYIDMERKQFYRTAKAMHLPDAKFPGDQ